MANGDYLLYKTGRHAICSIANAYSGPIGNIKIDNLPTACKKLNKKYHR